VPAGFDPPAGFAYVGRVEVEATGRPKRHLRLDLYRKK
jgi:hypothetical protein